MTPVATSGTATVTLPTDEQILITREFDAPRHLVYKAWTTPELVKRWWAGKRGERDDRRDRPARRRHVALRDGRRTAASRSPSTASTARSSPNERLVNTEVYEGAPDGRRRALARDTFTELPGGRTLLELLIGCRQPRGPRHHHRLRDGGRDAGVDGRARRGRDLARLELAPDADVAGAERRERRAVPAGVAVLEPHAGKPGHQVHLGRPGVAELDRERLEPAVDDVEVL